MVTRGDALPLLSKRRLRPEFLSCLEYRKRMTKNETHGHCVGLLRYFRKRLNKVRS
jgi:hypothetical protein